MTTQERQRSVKLAIQTRAQSIDADEPTVVLLLDEAEHLAGLLWEFVGHLAPDVGKAGYEFEMVERARELAVNLQAAVLVSVVRSGLSLVDLTAAHEA